MPIRIHILDAITLVIFIVLLLNALKQYPPYNPDAGLVTFVPEKAMHVATNRSSDTPIAFTATETRITAAATIVFVGRLLVQHTEGGPVNATV